jgi:DNA polymerase V
MPVFAIVDANCFFCSCERLINPSLKGKPVVVLSNNDGMIVARSNEAKALGIHWDAFHLIRNKLRYHNVHVFSSNYPLYSEISGRMMTVLKDFAPQMEVYSCDEAFLDLTGIDNLDAYGNLIQRKVMQYCGIPVSVGIARTKTLAKLANRVAKKSPKLKTGMLNLVDSPYLDVALKRVEVRHVWGVGRRWEEQLRVNGITTAYDLAMADPNWLIKRFNVVLTRTALELKGTFCLPLQLEQPISKTIMSSMSFGKLIEDFATVRQAICTYAAEAAAKMRRENLACSYVVVYLETNRFIKEAQYNPEIRVPLPYATDNSTEIIQSVIAGLHSIFQKGYRYNKGGVIVGGLIPIEERQVSLFEINDRKKVTSLMYALDTVNTTFGPGTLRYGAQGLRNAEWQARQNYLSSDNNRGLMTQYQQVKRICELGQNTSLIRAL